MKIEKLNKLNKLFIGVIIIALFAYIINVIDISFFANNLEQITSKLALITNFIPAQDVQQINNVLDILNNATNVIKAFFVVVASISGVVSIIGLLLIKLFAGRVAKYQSFFNYCGLIITAGVTVYMQYRLMPSFDGLVSLFVMGATLLIIGFSIVYVIVGVTGLYKLVMSDEFKINEIYTEIAKVISFILIFYTGVIIIGKINVYMSVAVLVKEIDLASLIDVMNYIKVDWNAIIPPVVLSTGYVSPDSINLFINNVADKYILDTVSKFVQEIILSTSSSFIFNNMLSYVTAIVTAAGILYTTHIKFDYQKYLLLGLMATALVINYAFIGGLIASLLSLGYIVCMILIFIDLVKEFKE